MLLDPADASAPFKHFCPRFTIDTPIELVLASAANVAFCFKKGARVPEAADTRGEEETATKRQRTDKEGEG